jgi:hypothetical protein
LKVAVRNDDNYGNGLIGTSLVHFLETVAASSNHLPSFHYLSIYDDEENKKYDTASGDELQEKVLNGDYWAAIHVHSNATLKLTTAIANNCANVSSYQSTSAITFYWDEGRNTAVTAPYINGIVGTLLTRFSTAFATKFMILQSNSTITSCVHENHSSILVQPVSYTTENLTPASMSYTASSGGINIGNILVAVLSANFIVLRTMSATAALCEDLSPIGKVGLRSFTMLILGFGLSLCYATMLVGFTAHGSSQYVLDGAAWAQIFGIIWINFTIWYVKIFLLNCIFTLI